MALDLRKSITSARLADASSLEPSDRAFSLSRLLSPRSGNPRSSSFSRGNDKNDVKSNVSAFSASGLSASVLSAAEPAGLHSEAARTGSGAAAVGGWEAPQATASARVASEVEGSGQPKLLLEARSGRIAHVSRGLLRDLGYTSSEDFGGKSLYDLADGLYEADWSRAVEAVTKNNRASVRIHFKLLKSDRAGDLVGTRVARSLNFAGDEERTVAGDGPSPTFLLGGLMPAPPQSSTPAAGAASGFRAGSETNSDWSRESELQQQGLKDGIRGAGARGSRAQQNGMVCAFGAPPGSITPPRAHARPPLPSRGNGDVGSSSGRTRASGYHSARKPPVPRVSSTGSLKSMQPPNSSRTVQNSNWPRREDGEEELEEDDEEEEEEGNGLEIDEEGLALALREDPDDEDALNEDAYSEAENDDDMTSPIAPLEEIENDFEDDDDDDEDAYIGDGRGGESATVARQISDVRERLAARRSCHLARGGREMDADAISDEDEDEESWERVKQRWAAQQQRLQRREEQQVQQAVQAAREREKERERERAARGGEEGKKRAFAKWVGGVRGGDGGEGMEGEGGGGREGVWRSERSGRSDKSDRSDSPASRSLRMSLSMGRSQSPAAPAASSYGQGNDEGKVREREKEREKERRGPALSKAVSFGRVGFSLSSPSKREQKGSSRLGSAEPEGWSEDRRVAASRFAEESGRSGVGVQQERGKEEKEQEEDFFWLGSPVREDKETKDLNAPSVSCIDTSTGSSLDNSNSTVTRSNSIRGKLNLSLSPLNVDDSEAPSETSPASPATISSPSQPLSRPPSRIPSLIARSSSSDDTRSLCKQRSEPKRDLNRIPAPFCTAPDPCSLPADSQPGGGETSTPGRRLLSALSHKGVVGAAKKALEAVSSPRRSHTSLFASASAECAPAHADAADGGTGAAGGGGRGGGGGAEPLIGSPRFFSSSSRPSSLRPSASHDSYTSSPSSRLSSSPSRSIVPRSSSLEVPRLAGVPRSVSQESGFGTSGSSRESGGASRRRSLLAPSSSREDGGSYREGSSFRGGGGGDVSGGVQGGKQQLSGLQAPGVSSSVGGCAVECRAVGMEGRREDAGSALTPKGRWGAWAEDEKSGDMDWFW
ncbi:unnamed protein product [Closterium sp. Naga37s-1]|nr:unnamed protein product [Closterium sp. Naga37s-1]